MCKNLKEIERDKKNARKELQKEVGALAVLAAGKILEQELDCKKQEAVINKIIEEAEDTAEEAELIKKDIAISKGAEYIGTLIDAKYN